MQTITELIELFQKNPAGAFWLFGLPLIFLMILIVMAINVAVEHTIEKEIEARTLSTIKRLERECMEWKCLQMRRTPIPTKTEKGKGVKY